MADEIRLASAVEALNDALVGVTPYKLAVVDPKAVQHVERNAHYMPQKLFRQLSENIKQDGNLSSLPFCWRRADGVFVCLSGNHRIDAAALADVKQVMILYTDAELTRDEQIAIQLSHNSLVGQDDASALRQLWQEIDRVKWKVYTGLDDKYLATIDKVQVQRLDDSALRFEELRLQFVPSEFEYIAGVVRKCGKENVKAHRFMARVADFYEFFEALLNFKEAKGILNTSTAFLMIIQMLDEWQAAQDLNTTELKNEQQK